MIPEDKIAIILQARMGSSRLPGKVLKPFGRYSLLQWILLRLGELPWSVIIATSNHDRDSIIQQFCKDYNVECFRGSEEDVLDRYYVCAKRYKLNHIIRLTADNPFTDVDELRQLIKFHIQNEYDYSHNFDQLPVGVGAEIFTENALATCWEKGIEKQHREHVNEYILENPQLFNTGCPVTPKNKQRKQLLLTIDTKDDYQRILKYKELFKSDEYISTELLIRKCLYSV